MPDTPPQPDQTLRLPSLFIKNFRGIDELTIPRLGRVTLLAGKNGVGKTTVLDAVRIWAARGHQLDIAEVLHSHDEVIRMVDEDGQDVSVANWNALFHGRSGSHDSTISIGPSHSDKECLLRIRLEPLPKDEIAKRGPDRSLYAPEEDVLGLEIKFQGTRRLLRPYGVSRPLRALIRRIAENRRDADSPEPLACETLGPDVPDNAEIAEYLNALALTPQEEQAVQALNLVTDKPVSRVALVDSGVSSGPRAGRRVLVKIKGEDLPVPLRSLGEGAVRAFSVALALANSSDGILLIDEAENGIHYLNQPRFWKMVLQTAQRNNVQVLATTHSWDALEGFSRAATELELGDKDCVLYRIQRNLHNFRAVEYPKSEIAVAAQHRIEVR